MKLSFTTLGCPSWDLDTLCDRGSAFGYDGVDFRGLQDDLDITQIPAFTTDLATTKQKLQDANLQVCTISSSISVCIPEELRDNIEEAKRTIPIAAELGCPNVRVFGNGDLEKYSREELADIGRDTLEQILELDSARDFRWIFETHDLWISAADCTLLLDRISDPAFGVLWDMGHTTRVGGETPQQTFDAVGERIYYAHIKDALRDPQHERAMNDGWRYVPPGTGQLPLTEAIALLREHGYDGWLMFEHEKRWHPELEEPEEIFPKFVEWIKPLIA